MKKLTHCLMDRNARLRKFQEFGSRRKELWSIVRDAYPTGSTVYVRRPTGKYVEAVVVGYCAEADEGVCVNVNSGDVELMRLLIPVWKTKTEFIVDWRSIFSVEEYEAKQEVSQFIDTLNLTTEEL